MKILFRPNFYEVAAEGADGERLLAAVEHVIIEAVEQVVGGLPSFVAQIDVEADGPTPQITLLVSPDGVVVRLDFCIQSHIFALNPASVASDELFRSIVYHEFYHLSDRLDPQFRFDYHEDATLAGMRKRKKINAVWDVYIERRKMDRFGIRPFSAFMFPTASDERDAALMNLQDIFGNVPSVRDVFDSSWERKTLDYPELVRLADTLPDLGQPEPERQRKEPRRARAAR